MRPPAPAVYERGLFDAAWFRVVFGPSARMVLREIQRRSLRLTFSALGIAIAVGVLVVARFWGDAMDYLIQVQMHETQRWDTQVQFAEPRPERSLGALRHLPGVFRVEGLRVVPVRFRHRHHTRTSSIFGYPPGGTMQRILDGDRPVEPPEHGLMLTRYLGEILHLRVGDLVRMQVLQGDRPTLELPVVRLVDEPFGMQGHMSARALHDALGEEPTVSAALLEVDPAQSDEVDRLLTQLSDVVGISHMRRILAKFTEQSGRNIAVFSLVLTLFAATIVIGVVYDNARVSLSMRSRDLASLRVLGFTRHEIAAILIGELATPVFLAIPAGLGFGRFLAESMATGGADPEQFRLPIVISSQTYAFATVVTLASALVSAWLVRRKIDSLDLIGVLKMRE